MSALIMSVSSFQIYYAQQANKYALFLFLSLCSTYFFIRAIKDNKNGFWFGYLFSSALAVYTLYAAFFTVIAHSVFVAYYAFAVKSRDLIKQWLLILAGLTALFFPWVGVFLKHLDRVQKHFWIPSLSVKSVLIVFKNFLLGYYTANINSWGLYIFLILIFALGSWRICSAEIRQTESGPWRETEKAVLISCCLFIPLIAALLFSFVFRPVYLDRNLIFVSVFYYIVIANGFIFAAKSKISLIAVILCAGIIFGTALESYYSERNFEPSVGIVEGKPIRQMLSFIVSHYRKGDAIALNHASIIPSFLYYAPPNLKQHIYLVDNSSTDVNENDTSFGTREILQLESTDARKCDSWKGLWFIASGWGSQPVPVSAQLENWLNSRTLVMKNHDFKGMELSYYRMRSGT